MTKYFARTEIKVEADGETEPTVVLDGIRADWHGFESGVFALTANMENADGPAHNYWRALFASGPSGPNPLDAAPIVRIELIDPSKDTMSRSILGPKLPWLEFETGNPGGVPALLFEAGSKGLFNSDGEKVQISRLRQSSAGPALKRIFDMGSWPNSNEAQIRRALRNVPALSQVLAIDVGQGGANALIDTTGTPRIYFDVGAGMGKHSSSTPPNLSFCTCRDQPIVLSHWDTDHWAGARADPRLLSHVWIVPRQRIGPTHTKLATDILHAGGDILIYASDATVELPLKWENPRWGKRDCYPDQMLSIVPCTGRTRNDGGLALRIRDIERQRDWLLTGDASYDSIPVSRHPVDYAAVTASHHGAKQPRIGSVIPIRATPTEQYARLLYSFATPNSFGHPHPKALHDSSGQGWRHGPIALPYSPTGFDVLATGFGDKNHARASVAAGWRRRPLLPKHLLDCVNGLEIVR